MVEEDYSKMEDFVMFDTCIWERFMLADEKLKKKSPIIPNDLKTCAEIFEIIQNKKLPFKIYTSDFNIIELRDQIWKMVCDKKLYDLGYLPTEFAEGRSQLKRQNDKELIKTVKEKVEGLLVLTNKHKTYQIDFNFIRQHCEEGMTCFDAILVDQANQHKCKYLVTSDGPLVYHFNNKKLNCNVIKADIFLKKIK